MKRAIHFLLTFSCAIALCATASAQVQTTSAITGTVTDSSGAVMPGVKITVRNEETGAVRETVTNDAGHYSVQALRPGKYSITASLPGFKTAVVKDREVQVSIPAAVNFVLELGDVTQEVTVSAEGAGTDQYNHRDFGDDDHAKSGARTFRIRRGISSTLWHCPRTRRRSTSAMGACRSDHIRCAG